MNVGRSSEISSNKLNRYNKPDLSDETHRSVFIDNSLMKINTVIVNGVTGTSHMTQIDENSVFCELGVIKRCEPKWLLIEIDTAYVHSSH